MGDVEPAGRKPAYSAFAAACQRSIEPVAQPPHTNQMMINALYGAAVELRLADRWSLLNRAGLSLKTLSADRQGLYRGKPVQDLPNLSAAEKQVIARKLAEQLPRAASALSGGMLTSSDAGATYQAAEMDTGDPESQRIRQQELEIEVMEQEILALITGQRASLRLHRAILVGAVIGLLLASACASLFGVAILLLIL